MFTVLKEYLTRTSVIRKDCKYMLVSYVKHDIVYRDIISRWLKTSMSKAGIDMKKKNSFQVILLEMLLCRK